jgi:hypothetical protein
MDLVVSKSVHRLRIEMIFISEGALVLLHCCSSSSAANAKSFNLLLCFCAFKAACSWKWTAENKRPDGSSYSIKSTLLKMDTCLDVPPLLR